MELSHDVLWKENQPIRGCFTNFWQAARNKESDIFNQLVQVLHVVEDGVVRRVHFIGGFIVLEQTRHSDLVIHPKSLICSDVVYFEMWNIFLLVNWFIELSMQNIELQYEILQIISDKCKFV